MIQTCGHRCAAADEPLPTYYRPVRPALAPVFSGRTTTITVLARPDRRCTDHAVVEADIPDGFFAALGCRGEEQAAA